MYTYIHISIYTYIYLCIYVYIGFKKIRDIVALFLVHWAGRRAVATT